MLKHPLQNPSDACRPSDWDVPSRITPQEKSPLEPDTKDGGRAPLSACRASRRQHARRQVRDGVAASSSRCPTGRCCQSLSTSRVASARHGSKPSARRSLLIEAARSSISSSSSLWLAPSSAIGAVVVGVCLAGPQAARRGCERMLNSAAGGCLEPAAALDGYATLDTFVVSLCAGQEKSRILHKPTSEKTTFMLDFFPN